jgi:hypothetical protein
MVMRMSAALKDELWRRRSRGTKQYEIARRARINPSVLSAMLNDAIPLAAHDDRIQRLAGVLGLKPEDCVEEHAL